MLLYCLPSMQQHAHLFIHNAIKLSSLKPNYLRTFLLSFSEFINFDEGKIKYRLEIYSSCECSQKLPDIFTSLNHN